MASDGGVSSAATGQVSSLSTLVSTWAAAVATRSSRQRDRVTTTTTVAAPTSETRLRGSSQQPRRQPPKTQAPPQLLLPLQKTPRKPVADRKTLNGLGVVITSNDLRNDPLRPVEDRLAMPNAKSEPSRGRLTCFCNDHCNLPGNRCHTNHKCMVSLTVTSDSQELRYSCLDDDDTSIINMSSCRGLTMGRGEEGGRGGKAYGSECCDNKDLCNMNLTVNYRDSPPDSLSIMDGSLTGHRVTRPPPDGDFASSGSSPLMFTVMMPLFGILILIGIAAAVWWWRFKLTERRRRREKDPYGSFSFAGDDSSVELQDQMSSGSGSGVPMLVQSTVARSVTLIRPIGKGRYGEVWLGHYHGGEVAVKVFSSRDEASWVRENEVYSTVLLRHENILGFVAADTTSRASCTQHWLITHYHARGSLYDHLSDGIGLSAEAVVRLLRSAAAGLEHLHADIRGAHGKPAIAHRDIKSKNILVKHDLTCCIADLGLAVVRSKLDPHSVDLGGANARVGTKRYMAPEVLCGLLDGVVVPLAAGRSGSDGEKSATLAGTVLQTPDIDSFKRADVYAFGLVIWEVARRCLKNGVAEDYRVPYYDCVDSDPSPEEMREVVVTKEVRPQISSRWQQMDDDEDNVLPALAKMMQECWSARPETRLTMLRVKKSLIALENYVLEESGCKSELLLRP